MSRWVSTLGVIAIATMSAAACGDDDAADARGDADAVAGTVRVFAAASLTEAFTELAAAFERAHPGVHIEFNFAASSALAEQINQGADADVFVPADESNLQTVVDEGNATGGKVIARNRLALLVEPGNPKDIGELADLGRSGVVFVVCSPDVPCGTFAAAALAKANVTREPASLEENVKAVVSRVTLGEADAGIVYVTDVQAAGGKAEGVDIDMASDRRLQAVYSMAITSAATNRAAAQAWVDFVLSDEGQGVLNRLGFLAP